MERSECGSGAEDINVGRTLRDRYRLDERIGSGSMGAVYRAWDLLRAQPCAVKLLRLQAAARESIVVRFCDEARIVAQLCHPNIVELYDQGEEEDGTLFLIMELLRGHDLYALLRAQTRLPLARVLEIVRQVGSALQTVHLSGMVHRDIKPRNVFLTHKAEGGEPGPVKVIDFGLAKILDGQGSSRGSDGLLIGTPEYLAPEAWRGISSDIDARSDQWSLAVLSYRMLSGRLPFDGSNDTVMLAREILSATPHPLRQLVPDLPVHVEAAITQALAKDKELRFRTVLDFVRALHGLPLAGAVQLRREPQTALLYHCDQPTMALSQFSGSTAAVIVAPLATAIELTAMLPLVPALPVTATVPTVQARARLGRWRRLAPALGFLVIGAAAGALWARPNLRVQAAAPRLSAEAPGQLFSAPGLPESEPPPQGESAVGLAQAHQLAPLLAAPSPVGPRHKLAAESQRLCEQCKCAPRSAAPHRAAAYPAPAERRRIDRRPSDP